MSATIPPKTASAQKLMAQINAMKKSVDATLKTCRKWQAIIDNEKTKTNQNE